MNSGQHRLRMKICLTQSQRARLEENVFYARWALIESLRDLKFELASDCPKCRHNMTAWEIMLALNKNTGNSFFHCQNCGSAREPNLLRSQNGFYCQLPFYSALKTLNMLADKISPPAKLAESEPALYYAAIINFGSFRNTLLRLGVQHGLSKEEISGWQKKAKDFFGRVSNIVIAECAGTSIYSVRLASKNAGTNGYNYKKHAYNIFKHLEVK